MGNSSGGKDTCVPDALFRISQELEFKHSLDYFRRKLSPNGEWVSNRDWIAFANSHGMETNHLRRSESKSLQQLLRRTDGCFMIEAMGKELNGQEFSHMIVYLGNRSVLADNTPGCDNVPITQADRAVMTKTSAIKLLKKSTPACDAIEVVRIHEVKKPVIQDDAAIA